VKGDPLILLADPFRLAGFSAVIKVHDRSVECPEALDGPTQIKDALEDPPSSETGIESFLVVVVRRGEVGLNDVREDAALPRAQRTSEGPLRCSQGGMELPQWRARVPREPLISRRQHAAELG
jgi:hypothetical protein